MRQFVEKLIKKINYVYAISTLGVYIDNYELTLSTSGSERYIQLIRSDSYSRVGEIYIKIYEEEYDALLSAMKDYLNRAKESFINCNHPIFD